MNWQDLKLAPDNKFYTYNGERLFEKSFLDALKFHAPGLAAVCDESGAYHIDTAGKSLYSDRFTRTFGFYCNRAAVVTATECFHQTEKGIRAYSNSFAWTGNFQENFCPVRDFNNNYFHIDLNGNRTYTKTFIYVGDYKDGIACAKTKAGFYRHIDTQGNFLNEKEFLDLGVFHKNYATAKDQRGWHHIDKNGTSLYPQRYQMVEPFYNGFARVEALSSAMQIMNEKGETVLEL